MANAALREDPDVLVLDELRTAGLVNVALEAASRGQLVIGGFPAHTASGAIDRIIDLYPPEHRQQVQLSLAQNLRGVVAQVLLRKRGGGRVAAREVLLNTPAVASVLAEGKTSQLPMAIEGGRKHGMVPLNDALVGFVQSGAVDAREAYRRRAGSRGLPRAAQAPGRRHVVRRTPRLNQHPVPDPSPSIQVLRIDERLQLLQQELQHIVLGEIRDGAADRAARAPTTRCPRLRLVWPITRGSAPDVSSAISMKSSALRSDISRTDPAGVKTV